MVNGRPSNRVTFGPSPRRPPRPYEMLAAIGAGGMGEVYRARDTRLNRDVAIKVIAAGLADSSDTLARLSARLARWPRWPTPISSRFMMLAWPTAPLMP